MLKLNKFKSIIQRLSLLCILLYVISCSDEGGKYNVFKYNLISHPNSLDPAFAKSKSEIWVTSHIFTTLVKLNKDGEIVPSGAKHWNISEDGLKYTFNLNTNFRFGNTALADEYKPRSVKAEDYKYSLSRIIDSTVNSPGRWIFENKIKDENSFIVLDDSTFIIELTQPFRPFLSLLTMQYCSAVPKEAVESKNRVWKDNPIGSGPYQFKKWIKNQNIFLTPNKSFASNIGNLDGIKIHFIKDRKIAFLELLNKNLDYISGLESSFINEMLTSDGDLQEKHSNSIIFKKSLYLNSEYIGINTANLQNAHPLKNKLIRQALNYSIDKNQLLLSLRNSIGFPAVNGFCPVGLNPQFSAIKGFKYDFDKAKSLINKSGIDLELMPPIVLNTNKDYEDIMLFVAKQWEKLGLKVKVELMESSVLREGMRNGNISVFRASWIGDYPDPENFMSLFYSKNGAPPNYTRFENKLFDNLYELSNLETNDSLRTELFLQMENILLEEAPIIFLFYDQSSNFYSKSISGISNNITHLLDVENISKIAD